jgi:hypothetical protein
MLLLHDGLAYRNAAFLAGRFTSSGTVQFALPAEGRSDTCIGGLSFSIAAPSLPYPRPAEGGVETCILGFNLKMAPGLLPAPFDLVSILTVGGTSLQVKIQAVDDGAGGFFLRAIRGSGTRMFLDSPSLPCDEWVFLEFLVRISLGQGKVVIRANGTEIARAENLYTETGVSERDWDTVKVGASSSRLVSISDLYLCDARTGHGRVFETFLGNCRSRKIRASKHLWTEWSNSAVPTAKHRIIWLMGQSNQTGVGTSLSSTKWRSPNSKVLIWDRIQGPAAFRSLEATKNTSGFFFLPPNSLLWGPEMRFAERIASLYEQSGVPDVPHVVIVKDTQDGSFLYPYIADYCWNPLVPNNLYNGTGSPRGCALTDITSAVTALGGWAQIERVDIFWYQGEADSLYEVSTSAYYENLKAFLSTVSLDIPSYVPRKFYISRIHPRSNPGLLFLDRIRETQRRVCSEEGYTEVETDDVKITAYGLHMEEEGYSTLGDSYFEHWLKNQPFAEYLQDASSLPTVDSLFIEAETSGGQEISFSVSAALGVWPMMAFSPSVYSQSSAPAALSVSVAGKSAVVSVPSGVSWTLLSTAFPAVDQQEAFKLASSLSL